jgi:hypothetical protein
MVARLGREDGTLSVWWKSIFLLKPVLSSVMRVLLPDWQIKTENWRKGAMMHTELDFIGR